MLLRRNAAQYPLEIVDGTLVNRHRRSVDVLFRAVAMCAGANALGIILPGMSDDGAAGLLGMRNAGARSIAQDEQSCVVSGMTRRQSSAAQSRRPCNCARSIELLQQLSSFGS